MKEQLKEIPLELKESLHKIVLAGMGALALAEEEGSRLFKELVEKGQGFESKAGNKRQKFEGKLDQVKDQVGTVFHKVEDIFNNGISNGLSKMGVPTKDEVELLTKRVEELMKSVDGLKPEETVVEKKTTRKAKAPAAAEKKTTTRRTRKTTAKVD